MASPYPGMNPGVARAGQAIGAAMRSPGSGSPITAAGGSLSVESSDLLTLHVRLTTINTDLAKMATNIDSLAAKLNKVGGGFSGLFGGGSGGRGGGSSTVTAAPVSAFGGAGGQALGAGAVGEVAAQWAGGINSAMGRIQTNGMPIQLSAMQMAGMFGGTTAANVSAFTGISNLGSGDLAQAIGTIMPNSFLSRVAGGQNQKNLNAFYNSLTKINPAMGAAGATALANTLTTAPFLSFMASHGGAMGGGLINPFNNDSVNSPNTVYKTILEKLTGIPNLTPQSARRIAQSPGQWALVTQNAASAGISASQLLPFKQYAAAGMNLTVAETPGSNSVFGSSLARSTATTALQQNTFDSSAGLQNAENRAIQGLANFGSGILGVMPELASLGVGFGLLAKTTLSVISQLALADAALKGMSALGGTGSGLSGTGELAGAEDEAPAFGGVASGLLGKAGITSMSGLLGRLGIVGGIYGATSMLGSAISGGRGNNAAGGWRGVLGGVVGGAGRDAAIGTMIAPGVGTLIGAGIGAAGALANRYLPKSWTAVHDILGFLGDPPTGSTTTAGLQPNLSQGVHAMMRDNPKLKISSGYRTQQQQKNLYAMKGGQGVASPGHSQHQAGKAVDIGPPSQLGWVAANAKRYGLHLPAPSQEPWHLQAMGDPGGNSVITAAETWIGTPYVSGGNGVMPGEGVDCSRFVQEVYASVGITLPRTTYEQVKCGSAVNGISNAKPGDLIFYNGNDHVAIYIGGGKQIAAPHTGTTVQVQSVYGGISAIRRISGGSTGAVAASTAGAAAGAAGVAAAALGAAAIGTGTNVGMQNTFLSSVSGSWLSGGGPGGGPTPSPGGGSSASSGSGTSTTSTAAVGGGSQSVVSAVRAVTSNRKVQIAMLAGSALESNQNPSDVGNGSYGAWQIQMGQGVSQAQADDVNFAAKWMVKRYASAVAGIASSLWQTNPAMAAEQAAYAVEDPAAPYIKTQGAGRVNAAYKLAVSEVGGPMGDPTGVSGTMMPGASGGMASFSMGTNRGGGITLQMPIQVVGTATQQDATSLVQMVLAELQNQTGMNLVSR